MTYRAEVIIPFESGFPTLRTNQFNVEENNYLLLDSLDVAEERREVATVKMAYYQQKLKQGYDKGVKLRPLTLGDLVLRKVVGTATIKTTTVNHHFHHHQSQTQPHPHSSNPPPPEKEANLTPPTASKPITYGK